MKTLSLILSAAVMSVAVSGTAFAHKKDSRHDYRTLSKSEAVQDVMKSFRRLDRNGNGVLRYKEVKKSHFHGVDYRYSGRDRHNSWYVDVGYRDGYRDRNRRGIKLITLDNFHKFDRNGDHKITKQEAKKRIKRKFDKADRNYDGYLSRREIERSKFFSKHYAGYDGYDYRGRDRDRDRHDHRH